MLHELCGSGMLNLDRCDSSTLDVTAHVVHALQRIAELDPATVMVVGAECRNILHRALGHTFALRATTDLDIGIAVADWNVHNRLTQLLTPTGHTGIRYLVEGVPVDIMPFGDVERPPGIVTPARRASELTVFGFQEVFGRAEPLTLSPDATIRIPQPAGYAALKMRAWADRSAYGDDRDAPDLATVCYWYQESEAVAARLYDTEDGLLILEKLDWDVSLAATQLLGHDIAQQLGSQRAAQLSQEWMRSDLDYLAIRLNHDTLPVWTMDHDRRRTIVTLLGTGLSEG